MPRSQVTLYNQILNRLENKASLKQAVFSSTCEVFKELKDELDKLAHDLKHDFGDRDSKVEIQFTDKGFFEAQIKFSGDVLIFSLHSNVFFFPKQHPIFKLDYIRQDFTRAYCGVIHIHNFLADSLKYKRMNDTGFLIGRIFINKEKHFFMEGQSQLGFLYNAIGKNTIDRPHMRQIIELAMIYCMDLDLISQPYEQVKEISLERKLSMEANSGYSTGKHIGYKFQREIDPPSKPFNDPPMAQDPS